MEKADSIKGVLISSYYIGMKHYSSSQRDNKNRLNIDTNVIHLLSKP